MIHSGAAGIVPTGPSTWVTTSLLYAGLVTGTFGIENTLGPAIGRASDVSSSAGTGLVSTDLSADGVGTAWRGDAGNVRSLRGRGCHRVFHAVDEGVTAETEQTAADRGVGDHLALGIGATGARTGVDTFLTNAGSAELAVGAEKTLWTTVWWTTEVPRETGADSSVGLDTAFAVGTTWVAGTGILWLADDWFI